MSKDVNDKFEEYSAPDQQGEIASYFKKVSCFVLLRFFFSHAISANSARGGGGLDATNHIALEKIAYSIQLLWCCILVLCLISNHQMSFTLESMGQTTGLSLLIRFFLAFFFYIMRVISCLSAT